MTDRAHAPTAPRTAIVWSVLRGELDRWASSGAGALGVLDVGGGSGVFAVPLAELGHDVTVVDPSADALATLERRASEAGVATRVTGIQGDVDQLTEVVASKRFDLVLCHRLLEVVDDPDAAVATLVAAMSPTGRLSVLAANRVATVIARALGGHPAQALGAFTDPAGRWGDADGARRRFDTSSLVSLLSTAGLTVYALHGAGVVADLLPGAVLDGVPGAAEALHDLELAVAAIPPYRDVATHLHALAGVTTDR
ncbi:MAG TPA: methyltransferase domain-containing protein [Mycobacteriales bacterium]|nr:methyltransferase domain-containing protein [Mycobacteriales bacterium]